MPSTSGLRVVEVTTAARVKAVFARGWAVRRIAFAATCLLALAAGCATPVSRTNRLLTVWASDPRQEVLPTARGPVADDGVFDPASGEIRLSGAINETVCFQLALHSGILPVKNVNLEISPLRNEAGQDLRATVKIYRAWPVELNAFQPWQRLYRGDSCTPRKVYDILVPAESKTAGLPADIPVNAMVLTWIDLHVGKGSEPGRYAGSVRVTAQGAPVWTLNVVLQVRAMALPDEPAMPALARFDARQLCRMHLRLAGRPYAPVRLSPHDPMSQKAIELLHATARLWNEHGVVGVPVGYEPAVHVSADGTARMEWDDYDRLVQPLVDGSAFEARIRPAAWPVPLDAEHPPLPGSGNARFSTYQGLLRQMVEQSAEHFRLRRWDAQAYVEIDPGGTWPDDYVRWQRQIVPVLQNGDGRLRRLLRLPPEDLGAYGWFGWPGSVELAGAAQILSTPGRFFLYGAGSRHVKSRPQMWLRPDHPPFSPSLHISVTGLDPAAAGWAAWRLKAEALDLPTQKDWPESRQVAINRPDEPTDQWLIWPGAPWGLEEPVASIRLKRLRLGLQECKYLYLLRQHGRIHVDELLAESLVPLAGSLAYGRQYSEGLDGEIQLDGSLWRAGTELLAEEVRMAMAGVGSDEFATFTNRIAWQTFLQRTRQIKAWAEPARLYSEKNGTIRVQAPVEILNLKADPIRGKLRWAPLIGGWQSAQEAVEFGPVQPFQRARVTMVAQGPGIGADSAGHAQWGLVLEPESGKPVDIPMTVSAAAVLPLSRPVQVDGDLSDWPAGRFNQLSDFRAYGRVEEVNRPGQMEGRQTHAFVASDGKTLFIGARMQDQAEQMRVSQRNTVEYQAGVPVGEDLVEILIDADNGTGGGPERLIHIIVKANGAAVANLGVDMWPPVCRPIPLGTRVTAATRIYPDAWTAEVAIPLAAVKAVRPEPAYWGFSICRLRAANLEYSSWSGARMSCYHPSGLGNLLVPHGNNSQ